MSEIYKKTRQSTSIKLDPDLLKRIREDAEKEGRSITKQIEYMIKKYYDTKKFLNQ